MALARWLATNPSLLILDEPTQGIDVGSKSEGHAIIGELAAEGIGALLLCLLAAMTVLADRGAARAAVGPILIAALFAVAALAGC